MPPHPGFAKYYDAPEETLLKRTLVEKHPNELQWLSKAGGEISELLKDLDSWKEVDLEICKGILRSLPNETSLARARSMGLECVNFLERITDLETANVHKRHLHASRERLSSELSASQVELGALRVFFGDAHTLQFATGLPQRLDALNKSLELLHGKLDAEHKALKANTEATKTELTGLIEKQKLEVEGMQAAVKSNVEAASSACTKLVSEVQTKLAGLIDNSTRELSTQHTMATLAREETEKAEKTAKTLLSNEYVSAFGAAFLSESTEARVRAKESSRVATWIAGIGALVLALFLWDARGAAKAVDVFSLLQWASIRVVTLGLFAYGIGYFLKERRNFLHVSVSNRHRFNLCMAYLSAKNMAPDERIVFLQHLLPHVATLGKTGFITREDVSSIPGIKDLSGLYQTLKSDSK